MNSGGTGLFGRYALFLIMLAGWVGPDIMLGSGG